LVFSGTVNPIPASNGSTLVAELIPGEYQAELDPEQVQRVQPERRQVTGRSRLPQRHGIVRMAPQLVAELAGVAGARDDQRRAVEPAGPVALGDLRRRLGPAPLKALFEVAAGPRWPSRAPPGSASAACAPSPSTA
jgi:hypothetical protein